MSNKQISSISIKFFYRFFRVFINIFQKKMKLLKIGGITLEF